MRTLQHIIIGFLAKTKTTVLPHSLYSPNLTPCDFILFPKLVRHSKNHRFQSAGKSASQTALKDIAKNEFQKCFDDLYKRCQSVLLLKGLISKEDMFQQFNK
ncbi:hypothetical protein TNCV_4022981 [Trichonephila clavipes]|nr:hypothetical protein TNCV_4022981 [Trichonephila clavipes]